MQRQRGELVPVAEAISDLGGPVAAIRDASPQARRGFTRFDQVNQLVSASEADPARGFMARLLALCSLPRTNPGNRLQYKRVNGNCLSRSSTNVKPPGKTYASYPVAEAAHRGGCRGVHCGGAPPGARLRGELPQTPDLPLAPAVQGTSPGIPLPVQWLAGIGFLRSGGSPSSSMMRFQGCRMIGKLKGLFSRSAVAMRRNPVGRSTRSAVLSLRALMASTSCSQSLNSRVWANLLCSSSVWSVGNGCSGMGMKLRFPTF